MGGPQVRIFREQLTKYKASGSQLSLPPGFAKFLWESKFQTLSLINAEGLEEICHQRIHTKETKSIKTGRCWKKFCSKSRFKQGDTIKFEFGDKNENVAKVTKEIV
ncbi:hypothetical protein AAZX31_11G207000 [Glycine max]|uniref:TF-B3 domain-containing protein n=1 Tax=Glycine max TaxID=3847 RepID=A0A0R0HQN2_SOYBN|nr:hypothetical protein GYH30_031650 [Glycine max]KAH1226215.1 hypothetical protein GmHk_11G032935 [Glycine max]KRH30658.1 hypothetical protein GLYMA_11G198800v4 [Glycine max]